MKIIERNILSVSNEGEFENILNEKGIKYKVIARQHKVYEMSLVNGKYYDIFEYHNSRGERVLLATTVLALADDMYEEGILLLLQEDEEYTLEQLVLIVREYNDFIDTPLNEFLSTQEVAEKFNIAESTIRRAIHDGRLEEYRDCKKVGKSWLILKSSAKKLWG